MIERVCVENFKSLREVELELGRFTVLVGPNGCGKSSVLEAVMLAWSADLHDEVWRDLANAPDVLIVVHLQGHDGFSFRMEVNAEKQGAARGVRILFGPGGASWNPDSGLWQGAPDRPQPMDVEALKQFRAALLHPQADKFAKPSRVTGSDPPELEPNGEGLASVLAYIAGYDPNAFLAISRDLALVVPGIKHVRVIPTRIERWEEGIQDAGNGHRNGRRLLREEPGHRFWIEFANGRKLPSELISEGTAVALGILTLLHMPNRPRLLLIDDIDRGLHIEAQAKLVQLLRGILELDSGLQIVCTTHSPYLLDLFQPEEVRVLALDEERHTRVSRLTAHPDFDKWRFGTQTGELWAALGHAWVAEPRATQP